MGIVKNKGSISTILTYLGVLVGYFNMWLMSKYLTPDEIGVRSLLFNFSFLFALISMFGFGQVVHRYFPRYRDNRREEQGFLFFVLTVPLLLFMLTASVVYYYPELFLQFYREKSEMFVQYFELVFPLSFGLVIYGILENYGKAHLEIVAPSFLKEVLLKFMMAVVTVLFVLKLTTLQEFYQYTSFLYIPLSIVMISYLFFKGKFKPVPHWKMYSGTLIKDISNFSVFTMLIAFSSYLMTSFDILMVASIEGEFYTGIYTIAVFIATMIEIPTRAFSQIYVPLLARFFEDGNLGAVKELYQKSSNVMSVVGGGLLGLLLININEIMEILPKTASYKLGIPVILFIGCAKLMNMVFSFNGALIMYSKHYKASLWQIIIFLVVAISSNYFLIHQYGFVGASMATLLSMAVYNLIKMFYIKTRFGFIPFVKETLFILVTGVVLTLMIYPINIGNDYLSIVIKTILFGGSFGGLVLFFRWSEEISIVVDKLKAKFL